MSKILVVDDDPGIRRSLSTFLSRSGFEVVTAENGEEGYESLKTFSPHLVIMDVLMPKLDGRETLRTIRRSGRSGEWSAK